MSVIGPHIHKRRKTLNSNDGRPNDAEILSVASTSNSSTDDVIATTEWQWSVCENNPTIWKCTETPQVSNEIMDNIVSEVSVYEIFHTFLGNDFWEMVSAETNKYANQCFCNANYKKKIYDDKWIDTTPDEMKAYFALCILMSQVRKPKIKWYWSKRAVIETPIYSITMPFKRFFLISRFLHFSDNEAANKEDRICKIRNIVEYLNSKFLSNYVPDEDISLDESLMKFRGRLAYNTVQSHEKSTIWNKIL